MATTITAQTNQSFWDLAIQGTGAAEAAMQFAFDNAVSISDTPTVGAVYVVSDAALALGDAGVLKYIVQNEIIVGTAGSEAIDFFVTEDTEEEIDSEAGGGVMVE